MNPLLRRDIGTFSAIMIGLGSIMGSGVFVSIGIAAGIAGPAVVLSIVAAGIVATLSGLSSAQLAAAHPVSGGTYEYGYKFLRPWLGFSAGWVFLCAKSFSAATAALGAAGYILGFASLQEAPSWTYIGLAVGIVALLTSIALAGIKPASIFTIIVVAFTISALLAFVILGFGSAVQNAEQNLWDVKGSLAGQTFLSASLEATALMFVAYTGYARIATLGEEVRNPRKAIPRAIVATLWISAILYVLVCVVAVGVAGASELGQAAVDRSVPLLYAAQKIAVPGLDRFVSLAAIAAMLGVLLNLILGLSRVLMAMGRRGDMPQPFARLNASRTTPTSAVLAVGITIALLTLIGNVKITWSFSAFSVLIYYGITNLAALALPAASRMYGRWVAAAGLVVCIFLAFWVTFHVWLIGLAIIIAGWGWHLARTRTRNAIEKSAGMTTAENRSEEEP